MKLTIFFISIVPKYTAPYSVFFNLATRAVGKSNNYYKSATP